MAVGLHFSAHVSGYPSAFGGPSRSEFRVEKARAEATLMLTNGMAVRGWIFVSVGSRTHTGSESVKDVLNDESGFFPFEVARASGSSTSLYNRDHVVVVELAGRGEIQADPGYDVAIVRTVAMLLSNGVRLRGAVRVHRPQGRDRLSDFARGPETFRYLESEYATYLINVRHIVELEEEIPAS